MRPVVSVVDLDRPDEVRAGSIEVVAVISDVAEHLVGVALNIAGRDGRNRFVGQLGCGLVVAHVVARQGEGGLQLAAVSPARVKQLAGGVEYLEEVLLSGRRSGDRIFEPAVEMFRIEECGLFRSLKGPLKDSTYIESFRQNGERGGTPLLVRGALHLLQFHVCQKVVFLCAYHIFRLFNPFS